MLAGRTFDHVFVKEVTGFKIIDLNEMMTPKKVIFNDPATIIYWSDGSKTVVKCGPGDAYDREKGFAMCVLKRLYGNNFHAMLKKHVPQEETKEDSQEKVDSVADLYGLVGIDSEYTDNKYGWTNLSSASIKATRDGYILDLPRPVRHI